MTAERLYPLKLQPALHKKVWGGRLLESALNKNLPGPEPYGESWEAHDSLAISNGDLRGATLGELTRRFGAELIGAGSDPAAGFPLLAKFIHARRWLSAQVHPDDRQARELEGEPRGKTEAWLILRAASGAKLVAGLQPGATRQQLARAIRQGALEDLLVYAEVEAGQVLYLPANTVHALGPGLLVYEIQQASDITYRLYDWERLGLDGKPRALHIERGLAVANLEARTRLEKPGGELLASGEYFRLWRHRLCDTARSFESGGAFHIVTCLEGAIGIDAGGGELRLGLGETAVIPACFDSFALRGAGVALRACPV